MQPSSPLQTRVHLCSTGLLGVGGGAFQNQILTFLFLLKVATTCLLLLILASRDEVLPHMTVRVGKARVTKGRFQTCWFHWSEPHPTRRLAKTQVGYRFNLQKVEALNKIRSPSSGARGSTVPWGQARLCPSHHQGDQGCSMGEGPAPCGADADNYNASLLAPN